MPGRTSDNGRVMTFHGRVGSRAPLMGLTAAVLALLLLPTLVLGADWTPLRRVSGNGGSRLDSMHQLAAANGKLFMVYPRIGSGPTDDRVVYLRSGNNGTSWSRERALFASTNKHRHVVPNLAIAARGDIVVVAWRVKGPEEHSLFVRVSRDGGNTFGIRTRIVSTTKDHGVGVPAVAIGNDVVAVSWTNRASGKVRIRTSRNGGRTFKAAKTLGRTSLSIDCRNKLTDGLVGIAANDKSIHVAWSYAPKRQCLASSIRVRTSIDRGRTWSPLRTITNKRSYGWPELDARGKTVVATVQSPTGGIITARSIRNGRKWDDKLRKAQDGFSFSAADITLLPEGRALMTYVKERIRNDRLISTKVVSRRSPDNGASFKAPKAVTADDKLLRMAPNIANNGKKATIVVQSGQLDGSPRNVFASRLR